MQTAPAEFRFSMESLELRDELHGLFNEHLRRLVRERLAEQKREVVTEDDVMACASEAFQLAQDELGMAHGATQVETGDRFGR